MTDRDQEFLQSLRATFRIEAAEHLQTITTGLLELEKVAAAEQRRPLIEQIFRAAHSLKGAARAVNFPDIESLCQSLEDLFAAWKRGTSEPTAPALDTAHRALDRMAAAVAAPISARRTEPRVSAPEVRAEPRAPLPHGTHAEPRASSANEAHVSPTVGAPREPSGGRPPSNARASTDARPIQPAPTGVQPNPSLAGVAPAARTLTSVDSQTVRVPVSALDKQLLEAEELLAAKLLAAQRAADLGSLAGRFEPWHKEWARTQAHARALRARADRSGSEDEGVEDLLTLVDFCEWNQDYVRAMETRVVALRRAAEQDRLMVARLVDDLLENSKKLVMLPLATLGTLLPKVVRDLSRDQGKDVELTLRGEDVKIDKRILEEMKDPLIHLLRNCVDHGIEKPEQRRRAGKPERAHITLAVSSVNGNQIEVRLSDDGAGIDVARVKAAAIRKGLITAEAAERVTKAEALAMVFEPDISTSPMITEVSGRGLGLAIVREKAERLGGRIAIESEVNAGTTIRITLPLTLATFRGVLVEAEQRRFVIPTAQVERVARFRPGDVQTVEGRETLALNGRTVALVRLADVLKLPAAQRTPEAPPAAPLVVLGAGEQRVAFSVDAVIEEREVLLKPLRKPLSRVRNVVGATVLANGEVAPVLNVVDLLKSARSAGAPARDPAQPATVTAEAKRILVAEDSITSRMLLKGILESAGYRVKTAVDGMEAFAALRAERFDALVSDVEMPRLNGFDLTSRVRADRALAELPVVLVTALESREHRERGVDVGANAYLVKSDLDQTNLLEALRRLA